MTYDKMKVAMICHFSNSKVRSFLPLDNRKLYTLVRKLLGMPHKSANYGDVASWDTDMIENLRKRNDVDLYVISAHSGLKRGVFSFEMENVHYYFVRCDTANLLSRLIPSPKLWHKLNPMRPKVRRIVDGINPNIIALIGAENAYISGTIVGLKEYPIIVKCQTIYNNPNRGKYGEIDAKNAYVERLIFDQLKYVSVTTGMHEPLFREFNKTAINFKWSFPKNYCTVEKVEKEYDFVNFAVSMIDGKGFPDAIRALAIVKKSHPNVKLNLTGGGSAQNKELIIDMIAKLNLKENVTLTSFFEQQSDLFQHIQKSRFALLPCKMDYISSTIWQAMHYELPVICYQTEGTVTLNSDKQRVLIAENGNIEDLAKQMCSLLENSTLADQLCRDAKAFSDSKSNNEDITNEIVSVFKSVVAHYNEGKPIPQELLYYNKK